MGENERILVVRQDVTGQQEERLARQRATNYLDLDFFGAPTRLHVNSQRELLQWEYFFKYFLPESQPSEPVVSVWVGVDDSDDSFLESLFRKDYSQKSVYVMRDGRFVLLDYPFSTGFSGHSNAFSHL